MKLKLTRDDRDMMMLSVLFTLCIFLAFGAIAIAAIIVEAIIKAL
jgi:hypothetical protein